MPNNPFIISGYVSPEYFCDRKKESEILINNILNGRNTALISTRRMGKTGLIRHCFENPQITKDFNTFFIDIYAVKSLKEFTVLLSKAIVKNLIPSGLKAVEKFWNHVKSLQAGISFDPYGNPAFNLQLGDIRHTDKTLDEIFGYMESSGEPNVVAIDEFQQITTFNEKNTEAVLRTYIQQCSNAQFIFAGSQRHVMSNIFMSASRPFYQSVSMLQLDSIPVNTYVEFASDLFRRNGKSIDDEAISAIYRMFDGITWYMQKMLNELFAMTPQGDTCHTEMTDTALGSILDTFKYAYSESMFRLPEKQKEMLIAIAKEKCARNITSEQFIGKYHLGSASSVQSATRGLLKKDFITEYMGEYSVYDRFFGIWLRENY